VVAEKCVCDGFGDELKRLNMGCWKSLSGLGNQLRLVADGGDICDGMIVRWEEMV
jgi:hypothetical protein